MPSVRDPVAYFVAGIPQTKEELQTLVDAWDIEINTDVSRRDSPKPLARMAWMRSFQAVRCIKELLKVNDTFLFEFRGMAHTCVFKYRLTIGQCVFDMLVRWKTKLRFNFVRVSLLSEMEAQVDDTFTYYECANAQLLEELFWEDIDLLKCLILEGGLPPMGGRIPLGDFTLGFHAEDKFPIRTEGLEADVYIDKNHPEMRAFFAQFCMEAQWGGFSIPVEINHKVDSDSLTRMETMLTQLLHGFKDLASAGAISICTSVVALWRSRRDITTCACILMGLGATLKLSPAIVGRCTTACLNYLRGPRLQAQDATYDIVPVVSVLGVIVSAYALDKIPGADTIDGMCKKLNNLGRGVQGGNTLFLFFEKHASHIMDIMYEHLFGIPQGVMSLDKYLSDIGAWITEVQELSKWEMTDMIVLDVDVCKRVDQAYTRGNELQAQLLKLKVPMDKMAVFNHHFRVISKVFDRILNLGKRKYEARVEPIVIHFYGESGVGKSCLIRMFAQDMMLLEEQFSHEKLADDVESNLYFRSVEQEFWDGYRGQFGCVYDDWTQQKDSASNPNVELMELIRCCNVARYPLHMADIIEKARAEFRSRLIILTSNHHFPYVESLNKPEAVMRRRDIVVRVTIDPQYAHANGSVNTATLDSPLDSRIYRFELVDSMDKTKIHATNLTYEQFLTRATDLYTKRRSVNEDRQQLLRERALERREDSTSVKEQYLSAVSLVAQANVSDLVLNVPDGYVVVGTGMKVLEFIYKYTTIDPTMPARISGMESNVFIDLSRMCAGSLEEFYTDALDYAMNNNVDIWACNLYAKDTSFLAVLAQNISLKMQRLQKMGQEFMSSIKTYLKDLWNTPLFSKLKFIAKMFGFAGAAFVAWKLFSATGDTSTSQPLVTESREIKTTTARKYHSEAASNDFRTRSARKMKAQFNAISKDYVMEEQAALDPNQKELISCVVYRNIYKVFITKDGYTKSLVNAFFVKGRCALLPAHGLFHLQNADTVTFRNASWDEGFSFPGKYFQNPENFSILLDKDGHTKDAIMIVLPRGFPSQRDLTSHIVRRCDLGSYQSFRASIPLITYNGGKWVHTVYTGVDARVDKQAEYDSKMSSGELEKIKLRHSYLYNTDTDKGDCGAPLVVANTSLPRKLVGFHVAGGVGIGCATSFTLEDINQLLSAFPLQAQISLEFSDVVSNDCETPEGGFIPVGKVDRNYAPAMKTSLQESPLHGSLDPVISAPSALRNFYKDGVLIDPLAKGLKKCGVSQVWIDPLVIERAKIHFSQSIMSNTKNAMRRVLTYEEAITGTDDIFLDPLNRRSSPGYPWVNKRKSGTVGKTAWLGDGDYILDNAELKDAVMDRIAQARLGKRRSVYWIDTLKDERRPLEKVEAGKTRVFAAGAQDYILAFRMYFLAFNAHVMQNMISNEVAVGINPYSSDWHRLSKALCVKGDKVVAGDFSNFDGTLNSQIMHSILDMVNEWYDDGPENCLIRTVLWEDIVSSIHIYRNNLYQWTHSQPSGNPMTVILNSCYNSISMRIVWLYTTRNTEFCSMKQFSNHVSMISYGDDNVLNISDEAIAYFNQITIGEGYERIGMKYTMEDKGECDITHRALGDVNFLKRSFTWDHAAQQYHGCLDMTVIMEMMNWVRGNLNVEESTLENISVALHELSLYPKDIYNSRLNQIKTACRTHLRTQPLFQTWEEVRMEQF